MPGRAFSNPSTVPVYGETWLFLNLALEQRDRDYPGCTWVFHYYGRRIGGHVKGWSEACIAAGFSGLQFHDLRRSAVRPMERAGIPRHNAMGISGHLTESVYRRYDTVSGRDLKEAGRQLETYPTEKWKAGEGNAAETQPGEVWHTIGKQKPKGVN
jgi:integrase